MNEPSFKSGRLGGTMTVFRFAVVAAILFAEIAAPGVLAIEVQNAAPGTRIEEVYIFRSIRTVRAVGRDAAEFCRSRVAFTSFAYDTSDLVSVAVDANGLVTDPQVKVIGRLMTCSGRTANPDVFD